MRKKQATTVQTKPLRQWEFDFSSVDEFTRLCRRLGAPIDTAQDTSILREAVQAGSLNIPNSLAVHPMEGCDGDRSGKPGQLTLRRYERFAAGGAGLIWGEATAVVPEGRANPRQLWLHDESRNAFAAMVGLIRAAAAHELGTRQRPILVAQLTHSGRYSKPDGAPAPIIAVRDPYRDPLSPEPTPTGDRPSKIADDSAIVTDEYLDLLIDKYVHAARLAFEAGFDAVDIKACHGYLINELLSAHTRKGRYGGSFENRTRLLLAVIDRIREEFGEDKPITMRLGVYDGIPYPYGWGVDKKDFARPDLGEPLKLIKELHRRGVRLISITAANPYYNPHVNRPFNLPIQGGYHEPEHPLAGVQRLIHLTGKIQHAFPDMAVVGTGYSWLRHLMGNVAAAAKAKHLVTIVGVGRMAFAYPDFARDLLTTGALDPRKVCVGCSACTQIMRDGGMTGCVVRDNRVYGPIFQHGRRSDPDNLRRLAQSCLHCQDATCRRGCPAGVDIPAFVQEFLHGDERKAYEIIRRGNVLPEICAWLCAVEQQCEGACLQGMIGDGPLPVADIQRYVAEVANQHGWSRLRYPPETTGHNVGVVGAGPAGLAAAATLIEAGHRVTIFDASKDLGGMIRSVIPSDRQFNALEHELTAIFRDVPEDRLVLRLGTEMSESFTLDSLMQEGFDAVFIGMGLPRAAGGDGMAAAGLYNALDFLSIARKDVERLDLVGRKVAVIGGGNTAIDAARTAKHAGAKDVYIVYRRSFEEMPATASERNAAMAEGIHFLILTQQLGYNTEDGRIKGIRVCPVHLGPKDSSGRRRPEPMTGAAYNLGMDVVVEAIGQKALPNIEKVLPGVAVEHGLIKTRPDSFETSRSGVFAGGDLVRGPSTVVGAVADGMAAAREIDAAISQKEEPKARPRARKTG